MPKTSTLEMLAFDVVQQLCRTAEAAALFLHDEGLGREQRFLKLIAHCSDRAEHIPQWFNEDSFSDERSVLRSLRDDLEWLQSVLSEPDYWGPLSTVHRAIPTIERLQELSKRISEKESSMNDDLRSLGLYSTHSDDLATLKSLGLDPWKDVPHAEEILIGEVYPYPVDEEKPGRRTRIRCYVTCMPAQFFRFVIVRPNENGDHSDMEEVEVKTGSGSFSEYWKMAREVAGNSFGMTVPRRIEMQRHESESERPMIDMKTVIDEKFAAGEGVLTFSESTPDEVIVLAIKQALAMGKAFTVIPA